MPGYRHKHRWVLPCNYKIWTFGLAYYYKIKPKIGGNTYLYAKLFTRPTAAAWPWNTPTLTASTLQTYNFASVLSLLIWSKTPEFTLKKAENSEKPRHTKYLKKSKPNLKCTLVVFAHKNWGNIVFASNF